jgi:hypothetical protein
MDLEDKGRKWKMKREIGGAGMADGFSETPF